MGECENIRKIKNNCAERVESRVNEICLQPPVIHPHIGPAVSNSLLSKNFNLFCINSSTVEIEINSKQQSKCRTSQSQTHTHGRRNRQGMTRVYQFPRFHIHTIRV